MTTEVYYHCWKYEDGLGEGEVSPYCNLRSPIILSIATLRASNPTIPINVLWKGTSNDEWLHFPEKLNFKVVPIKFYLEENHSDKRGWQHLSRLFDLESHATADTVIYSDLDIFWLQDVSPLCCDPNKFCFNGNNTGFFYYNRHSEQVKQFFEVFKAFTIGALHDENIRQLMKKHSYEAWYYVFDEMICTYMYNEGHKHLFNTIDYNEHACTRDIHLVDPKKVKMLHCNGLMVYNEYAKIDAELKHCRGLCCLLFEEFYNQICKVLNQKDLELIFTPKELSYYIPRQFSLLRDYQKLIATMSPDGHYHLQKCLKNSKLFP